MNYFNEVMAFNSKLFTSYTGDPCEIYRKINQSNGIYESIYEVWKKLKEIGFIPTEDTIKKVYEEWSEQNMEYMKKSYIPYVPEPMKKILEDSIGIMESYKVAANKFWQPWISSQEELKDIFYKGYFNNPSGYVEYFKLWKDNYDKSFSKFINTPMMGIDREFLEKQSEGFDKFIRFSVLVNEFCANIYNLTQETMKKIFQDYMEMYKEGVAPQTFEQFYKYYTKEMDNAFNKLFFSDEFSKLVGHMLDAMTNFKIESDKLWEEYLSFIPVPKKTEMDSLYKTVYDIKKETRSMKKEIEELKILLNKQSK